MLSQEQLKSIMHYDPDTGLFTWLISPKFGVKVGDEVGTHLEGYRVTRFKGTPYKLHRLAWLYVYGEMPDVFIDHINGIRDDNRIVNIRLATHTQNLRNSGNRKNNTLGFKGVCFDKRSKKYGAYLQVNGKQKWLGTFCTVQEAASTRSEAAKQHHGEFYYG